MAGLRGTPKQGLFGATLGFFIGFAAVALFGPTAARFQKVMDLSPMLLAFLVAMPALSGSLLRIPFSAWVDTTGGRKPFLVLLCLSLLGMSGIYAVVLFLPEHAGAGLYPLLLLLALLCGCGIATFTVGASQVSYWFPQAAQGVALAIFAGVGNLAPGIFSLLIPVALRFWSLAGTYLAWLVLLAVGVALYAVYGQNAWYFQLAAAGASPEDAKRRARGCGQELFPSGTVKESLRDSARIWHTWALVWIYVTTFGGFVALTAWLPTYWTQYFGVTPLVAGFLTALFSIVTSVVRMVGGILSDRLDEGGKNTAILALLILLAGSLVMTTSHEFELSVPGEILMAFGMGICNAAVFKLVPQVAPKAVGGAAGWVGGVGAFSGFAIPPMLGFAVSDLGKPGYSIGFVVFLFLSLFSLSMAWILKYTRELPYVLPAHAVTEPGPALAGKEAPHA
ncbi:MAG: MFS transporter [Acidobacteria bacterium]|nr:MFS transporter [Acidobacteriota bacterium]